MSQISTDGRGAYRIVAGRELGERARDRKVMPSRIILGQTALWEVGLSILLTAGAIAALIPLAARLYSGAILRTGKVKLREAWGASA